MREPFSTDVLIVGAGPVGLALALALGQAGVRVTVLEQREAPRETSRAIGVTPASLEILDRFGVAEELVGEGVAVREAVIHGDRGEVARVGFGGLPSPFRFILAIPQQRTETILEKAAREQGSVELLRGCRVSEISREHSGSPRVTAIETSSGETSSGETRSYTGRFLCGCDGKQSTVRRLLGVRWFGRALSDRFVMADIEDETDLGDLAHLYFTSDGSVESFPLPGGARRWIVQTERFYDRPPAELVQRLVERRSGLSLTGSRELWRSAFTTERRIATPFCSGPFFLAGDAAHLMPPIGGQGMNVGIADAEHLADLLAVALSEPDRVSELAQRYESRRRKAFRVAARRSILGMKIGTARGALLSGLREWSIPKALGGSRGGRIMEHFAMIASPNRRSPWRGEPEAR